MRKEFKYKGVLVKFVKEEDGWRYYASEDDSVQIKCKGMRVEVWE
jgi:hypothetical protein